MSFSLRTYRWLICLLVLGTVIYRIVLHTYEPFLHDWDEKFHALVAKSLLQDPFHPRLYTEVLRPYGLADWTANETWLHKPILFLWLIALSLKCFGASLFAARLPSILLSAGTVVILSRFHLRLFETIEEKRTIALGAGLLFVCFFQQSFTVIGALSTDHNDVAFLFFFATAWYFSHKMYLEPSGKWVVAIGLSTAAAILCKSVLGLIPLTVYGAISLTSGVALRQWKPWSLALLTGLSAPVIWAMYCWIRFPAEFAAENLAILHHTSRSIEGHGAPWHFYITVLWDQYGPALWVAIVLLLMSDQSRTIKHTLVTAPTVYVLVMSCFGTKMDNYLLPMCMAFLGLISWACIHLWKHNRWGGILFILISMWFVWKPDITLRYLSTGRSGHFIHVHDREQKIAWTQAMNDIKIEPDAIILGCQDWEYIDAMFFNECAAYPRGVSLNDLEIDQGRPIYTMTYDGQRYSIERVD